MNFKFWRKKSNFDCSFYDDVKEPKPVKPALEEWRKTRDKIINEDDIGIKQVLIKRGQGGEHDEDLTNQKFGIHLTYNRSDPKSSTLSTEAMAVAVLMDIRERLDKLIELNTPKSKKIKKEECSHDWASNGVGKPLKCVNCKKSIKIKPAKK